MRELSGRVFFFLKMGSQRPWVILTAETWIALDALSELQKRPAEDVLRDEIAKYIAGRLPAIDIDSALSALQQTAYQAGYLIGRLRRMSREFGED